MIMFPSEVALAAEGGEVQKRFFGLHAQSLVGGQNYLEFDGFSKTGLRSWKLTVDRDNIHTAGGFMLTAMSLICFKFRLFFLMLLRRQ